MKVTIIPSGPFIVNTLLLWDEGSKKAALVDPADRKAVEEARDVADRKGLDVVYILNTHEHPDHTAANSWAKLTFPNAELLIHEDGAKHLNFWTQSEIGQLAGAEFSPPPDRRLRGGEVLKLGSLEFKVIHTPGHSPGSVCFFFPSEKLAVVGDLIFKGSIGRYDLPMSDYFQLKSSILRFLQSVPRDTLIVPGHGETTTVEEELQTNPFIKELVG
ncbi:MBL fold metallo-hydrolase [Thermovibrio ammonificans]